MESLADGENLASLPDRNSGLPFQPAGQTVLDVGLGFLQIQRTKGDRGDDPLTQWTISRLCMMAVETRLPTRKLCNA